MGHCTDDGLNAALVVAEMADKLKEKGAPDTSPLKDLAISVIKGYKECPSSECKQLIKAAKKAQDTPSIETGLELANALNNVALDLLKKSKDEVAPQGKERLVSGNELAEGGMPETIVPNTASSSAVPRID